MPTQSPPQPSAPEPSGKPARRAPAAPASDLDAAAPEPAPESTLFHLLVERGWDPRLAYTADQRIHAMTSETAAAGLKPVLGELRQMRESLAGFATKTELQTELRQMRESHGGLCHQDRTPDANSGRCARPWRALPPKADLDGPLRRELAERETRLVKWVFGALLAQTAVIVGLVTLLK